MNRISIRRGGCICLFCLSLCGGLARQNEPAEQPKPAAAVPPDSASRRITLDVVVTDKSGKPLAGLERRDFTLLDNQRPREIAEFSAVPARTAAADPPVEIVLLVDEVNTSFTKVAFAREQIKKFLAKDRGRLSHPVSMAYLSDSGLMISKRPSRDGNALIAGIDQNKPGLRAISRSAVWGAVDRQRLSLDTLGQLIDFEMSKPGRKLLIWISPGWSLFTGTNDLLTDKSQQWLFSSVVAFSDGLRRARITLYHIDPMGTAVNESPSLNYEAYLKGVPAARKAEIGSLGLQVLAYQSGGRILNANNDVAGEIATCIADATAYYTISFDGLAGARPNEYHAIEIKIGKPGMKARARSGFYAQPDAAPAQ